MAFGPGRAMIVATMAKPDGGGSSTGGRAGARRVAFTDGGNPHAAGCVVAEFGRTKVHVTATVAEEVPPFMRGRGRGWVTAEYSMLPGSTDTRTRRDRAKVPGRTMEIQRLIGRSLRAAVDPAALGERTVTLDCDVLVADGGTRTASVSGAWVALKLAAAGLVRAGAVPRDPVVLQVAAVGVGLAADGSVLVDPDHAEDAAASTDMNVVMARDGRFVEVQGTAEKAPFSGDQLGAMLRGAREALGEVFRRQDLALGA